MRKSTIEDEYPVIDKMYKLTLEYSLRVKKFPRDTRYILGDRILNNCYDLLEGLIQAKFTRERAKILNEQNLRLEKLRFQTRMSKDLKAVSVKQYGHLAEQLNEIGKMIGGWLKSIR